MHRERERGREGEREGEKERERHTDREGEKERETDRETRRGEDLAYGTYVLSTEYEYATCTRTGHVLVRARIIWKTKIEHSGDVIRVRYSYSTSYRSGT